MDRLIRGQAIAQGVQHRAQGAQRMLPLRQMVLDHQLLEPEVHLLDRMVDARHMLLTHARLPLRNPLKAHEHSRNGASAD
jgi:hypothetical protein